MKNSLFNIMGCVVFLFISIAPSCPKSPDSYIEAGRKCYEKKDYPKAYKFYTRAIKLNPLLYQVYWERAQVDIKIDSTEKAIDDMTMYIDSNPDNKDSLSMAFVQRAEILNKKGYKVEACDDWNSACELNKDNAPFACQQYRLHCK